MPTGRKLLFTEEITAAQAHRSSHHRSFGQQPRCSGNVRRQQKRSKSLKRMVSALSEDRAAGIESRAVPRLLADSHGTQEPLRIQKMQIHVPGDEAGAAGVPETSELEARVPRRSGQPLKRFINVTRARISTRFAGLKFRKVTKKGRQRIQRTCIDGRILALDEGKQRISFVYIVHARHQNAEVVVEGACGRCRAAGPLLEVLQDRWAADMEELIYLGWITRRGLQNLDLLARDGESGNAKGTAVKGDDDSDALSRRRRAARKGVKMSGGGRAEQRG
ncbi:hypothetical protein ZWY2020_029497 [Hordeum vulgare]|nr:hypothetical protein ZWY2020_029497 [Hordeum vulgare]